MERRLGRGLGALLSSPPPSDEPQKELLLEAIQPNPFQPRVRFEEEGLEELKASIEVHGVLQPVVVRRATGVEPGQERYELVSGERRWRASRMAGKTSIPAVLREDVTDEAMLELALVENVQRRDLDPMERARGFRQLQERLGLTQEEVARHVGLRRSTVANHLRLLELPEKVQEALAQGLLSMGHAKALLGASDPQEQVRLMGTVLRKDLTVRETERRVREGRPDRGTLQPARRSTPAEVASPSAPLAVTKPPVEPWVRELEDRIRASLGTRVQVRNGADFRGQILIEYYDQASLESLIARLAPRRTV